MPDTDLLKDPLLEKAPVHEGYKVLGGVVLHQKLGQGAMGAVYRGRHLRLNLEVAVKVMAPPFGLSTEETTDFVRRFVREAQTAAQIDHQNLLGVLDVDSQHGVYFLIMQFIDGESAGDRLKRKGKLSEAEAVEICLGAADGLAEAYRKGIVHRDVKPDNIMIDKDGRVCVADLGLAKAVSGETDVSGMASVTQTHGAMGTPQFMPLEQFESARDVGPTADVWALGVTLYKLLTDELPWGQHSLLALISAMQSEPPRDVKEFRADLSDGVCEVIRKAMQRDPLKRYAHCGEMADALAGHLDTAWAAGPSVLPDAEAGSGKYALVSMVSPSSKTMTLIGKSMVERMAWGTGAIRAPESRPGSAPAMAAARPGPLAWKLIAIGGGAALVALVGALAFFGRGERTPSHEQSQAVEFYEQQLEAMASDQFRAVVEAIEAADSRYERTTYGARIMKLHDKAAARATEIGAQEEEARRQAAFEQAASAADEAEEGDDLAEAIHQLELALAVRDNTALAARAEALRRRLAFERLVAKAQDHENAGRLEDARAGYAEALEIATDDERTEVESQLEALTQSLARRQAGIALEEAVAAVALKVKAGEWRAAWDAAAEVRVSGLNDARLDDLARQAAGALSPQKLLTGPLGVEFVLVRGGPFTMGTDTGADEEMPAHKVTVSSFYIGRSEVTRAQFEAFSRKLKAAPKPRYTRDREPAVGVSWNEAMELCRHLSSIDATAKATYRLPTEAEWEFAARGASGRKYPWGDAAPTHKRANLAGRRDGFEKLAPVGSFPEGSTLDGVTDLVGNAAEWCMDWYGAYRGGRQVDPRGPSTGTKRVIRGGAFAYDAKTWSRAAMRAVAEPSARKDTIGFRVVRELTEEEAMFERAARGE